MPIRPENRSRYPTNWKAISHRIRFSRAQCQCECEGECGLHSTTGRCTEIHGARAKFANGKVILTVAHLDHTPENVADENLKAMCQRCHLRYDVEHHKESARKGKRRKA